MSVEQLNFSRLILAGALMGVGLGGFVDGILFHQILQLHNMVSGYIPVVDLVSAKTNMVWDGFFHAGVWIISITGTIVLVNAGARRDVPWSQTVFWGSWLYGWGLFNLIEGLIDHQLLGVHHVLEYSAKNEQRLADYAFLASGLILIIIGRTIIHFGKKSWLKRSKATLGV